MSKRANGEGSICKTKSGWRGQIMDGYKADGRRNIVCFSGKTRADVAGQIREYRNIMAANVRPHKDMKLADWADRWYEDHRTQVQPSTYSGYKYTLKIIKDRIGHLRLSSILPMDINRFEDSLVEEGYGQSSVLKCRAMLIQIFDSARANRLVVDNPARESKLLGAACFGAPRQVKDAFTDHEILFLSEELPNDMMGNSIMGLLYSGIRIQELLALAPEDIAPDGSSIKIDKAIKMVDGIPTIGPPKSKCSIRTVPIPVEGRKYFVYLRSNGGSEHIWSLPGRNEYYGVGTFRNRYYRVIGKLKGVRRLPPHCCRHTYVTRLQARGVPLDLITRLVGHRNLITTVGYTHTADATLVNAVSALDDHKSA